MPIKRADGTVHSTSSASSSAAASAGSSGPPRVVFQPVPVVGDPGPPGAPRVPFDGTPENFNGGGYPGISEEYARGDHQHPIPAVVYTNLTRPAPTLGLMIFNTDDLAPNWGDGTYWRDAQGNVT